MSVNVYDPVNNTLIPIAGATLYADVGVGFIGAFDAEEVPDGWLIFNGQTVLRSDYPDLWARANRNNQVGVGKFYGIGDGSTNFTLADLRETSLKGYGETSRSVGAHVKSGGLGIGEFIDDHLQDHIHHVDANHLSVGTAGVGAEGSANPIGGFNTDGVANARSGTTTEVKAVGVVWAVKARQTGLPIDLKEQVEKVEKYDDNTNGLHFIKNGKVVQFYLKKDLTSSGKGIALPNTIPSGFIPVTDSVRGALIDNTIDEPIGQLVLYKENRQVSIYHKTAGGFNGDIFVGTLTYICE